MSTFVGSEYTYSRRSVFCSFALLLSSQYLRFNIRDSNFKIEKVEMPYLYGHPPISPPDPVVHSGDPAHLAARSDAEGICRSTSEFFTVMVQRHPVSRSQGAVQLYLDYVVSACVCRSQRSCRDTWVNQKGNEQS